MQNYDYILMTSLVDLWKFIDSKLLNSNHNIDK